MILDEGLFARGDVVLCACSGGPDSTALLHVLASLRPRIGHRVVAHGIDHGLRPEAPAELATVADIAREIAVPFATTKVAVARGSNLQARARAERLNALARAAVACDARAIATGHTADDRAETVLLRLLRGAGPRGLAVLPPRAPMPTMYAPDGASGGTSGFPCNVGPLSLVRPLLTARREDVLAHLRRHSLAFASDPSNVDTHFTRVRVRRELIPMLVALSPRIVQHLCMLADMLGEMPTDASLERLGRAQRREVMRARRLGRRTLRMRMAGGQEVEVTFPLGRIVLIKSG
jgi:tRNA(Ile)-lysidine synthase